MKNIICIIFSFAALHGAGQSLRQQLLNQDTTLSEVKIISCKADPSLFITIPITEEDTWEQIGLVKFQNEKLIWKASFDTLPFGQSIRSARQVSLVKFKNPLIEIFDETHRQNGSDNLYELDGKNAKLLVSSIAVDNDLDVEIEINHKMYSRLIKDGQLKPTYADLNKDGYPDIKLTGTIQIVGGHYVKE